MLSFDFDYPCATGASPARVQLRQRPRGVWTLSVRFTEMPIEFGAPPEPTIVFEPAEDQPLAIDVASSSTSYPNLDEDPWTVKATGGVSPAEDEVPAPARWAPITIAGRHHRLWLQLTTSPPIDVARAAADPRNPVPPATRRAPLP